MREIIVKEYRNEQGLITRREIGQELVRCKECRHWFCHNDVDYDQSKFTYYCEVHGIFFEGDDYCSFGERKESK